jgi:hypothetical protein
MRSGGGAVFTAALLGVAIGFLVMSFALTPLGRLVPVWIVVPTIVLLGAQLWLDRSRARTPAGQGHDGETGADDGRRELETMAWAGLLLALIAVVGVTLAACAYVALYLMRECGVGWRASVGAGLVSGALAYGAVVVVLGKPLLAGALWLW